MTTSQIELVYEAIFTEFSGITVVGGYRTNPTVLREIRSFDKLSSDTEIGVEMGDSTIEALDSSATVFDEYVPFVISGVVRSTIDSDGSGAAVKATGEALMHDIKRVGAALLTKYAKAPSSGTAGMWNIQYDGKNPRMKISRFYWLDQQRAFGEFLMTFVAHLRREGLDFVV
jgi:hypothetical protein